MMPMHKVAIAATIGAAASIAVLVLADVGHSGTLYSRHGWWIVGSNTFQNGQAVCNAAATYTGGTYYSMVAAHGDSGDRIWALYFANPEWNWIKNKTNYMVILRAPSGRRAVNMKGEASNHSLFAFVDKEVINALAMDRGGRGVTVFAANRTLGTFRLDNSAAAIRDVVHCLRANPPTKTAALPTEKRQESNPSSGTGFFIADNFVLTAYHVIKDASVLRIAMAAIRAASLRARQLCPARPRAVEAAANLRRTEIL